MKGIKRILFIILIIFFALSVAACTDNSGKNNNGGGGNTTNTGNDLKPSDIKQLADLTNYGSKQASYEKTPVAFDANAKTYAGSSCAEQIEKLSTRINEKKEDVTNGDSTSSFVKIFAMSTAEGLLERMAKAALSFDEMNRVVEYLYGSAENPDLNKYLEETDNGWAGIFSDGTSKWLDQKNADNTAAFNAGWSFFDDWEMYDRLEKYTEDASEGAAKDLAGDNAAWHYRSILGKVYTEVKLDGDAAARTATYMLDYAIDIVESKSGGSVTDAIITSGGNTTFGNFATYCKSAPNSTDPFSGLEDYETLSYLLGFNQYYTGTDGLKNCVTLYGYYYDYNKTYYNESLADETTYAKQLKYEKQNTFTDTEWLDYVAIQRNNYVKAYRYSENCYSSFYQDHFEFQGVVEDYDSKVYEIDKVTRSIGSTMPGTTYTLQMKSAIAKTGSIDGLAGQLALSDWMWCYSGSEDNMKKYNVANTKYENGKEGSIEAEYEGKFDFEMQQLYIIQYLLANMTESELASALYYNVYAYSASMVNNMTGDIKDIVYIIDGVEEGSHYTTISTEVAAGGENLYAREKIKVIYDQTYESWKSAGVSTLATNASSQNWSKMKTEIDTAIGYDYMNMPIKSKNTQWKERTERLEDLVIARVWSCCGQRVSEADNTTCEHVSNDDGSVATKEYATDHTISQFASKYEPVLMHIGGQAELSFRVATKGYTTQEGTAITDKKEWKAGYNGTIASLRANTSETTQLMDWSETTAISVSAGDSLFNQLDDLDQDDSKWWNTNKTNSEKAKFDAYDKVEVYNGANVTYTYSYVFKGWYLDKDCKYEYNENDDVNVNLIVYAGYDVTKTRK